MTGITTIKTKKFFNNAINNVVIDDSRKELLNKIVIQIVVERKKIKKVKLNFICTHNSRRSQLAQVWAHYAIQYFKLKQIKSYSGGTEITSVHKNIIRTLQCADFKFLLIEFSHKNPVYEISYKSMKKPIIIFSKPYDDVSNKKPFIAITTCGTADKNCPFIPDALKKIHLPYIDPKYSDNTTESSKIYLETSLQIAAEMHFIFKRVKNLL